MRFGGISSFLPCDETGRSASGYASLGGSGWFEDGIHSFLRAPLSRRISSAHVGYSLAPRTGYAYLILYGRWLMRTHLLLQLLMVAVLAPTWAYAGPPGLPSGGGPQSEPVRKGVGHFDKAFFDLTPHKRDLEASHEYDLAIAEFQRELAVRPASAEAHAYLARIYYLRNQLNKAASHYDQ